MKYAAIAIGALVLGFGAFADHSWSAPSRPVGPPAVVRMSPRPIAALTPARPEIALLKERVDFVPKASSSQPGKNSLLGPQTVLVTTMVRELGLAPQQASHMESVLLDRQEQIEAYHRQTRASGVFRPTDYETRVRKIQADSYVRLASVLDRRQYRLFTELIASGRMNDAVEFEVDPSMVILE